MERHWKNRKKIKPKIYKFNEDQMSGYLDFIPKPDGHNNDLGTITLLVSAGYDYDDIVGLGVDWYGYNWQDVDRWLRPKWNWIQNHLGDEREARRIIVNWAVKNGYKSDNLTFDRERIPRKKVELVKLPVLCRLGKFTITDILKHDIFMVTAGKIKPWQNFPLTRGFRQSLSEYQVESGEDPIAVVRYGGRAVDGYDRPFTVIPHRNYFAAKTYADKVGGDAIASLCFAGSEVVKMPISLGVIDCDYKPDRDVNNTGQDYRDAFIERCRDLGLPMFESTSGNGLHALFSLSNPGDLIKTTDSYKPDIMCNSNEKPCLAFDLYYPGALRFVAINWDRGIDNYNPNLCLREITKDRVDKLIKM